MRKVCTAAKLRVGALAAASLMAAVLAFIVTASTDSLSVRGADAILTIHQFEKRKSQVELYSSLAKVARSSGVHIAKVQRGSGSVSRSVFTINPAQESFGTGKDFNPATRSIAGDPRRLSDLDIRGDYVVRAYSSSRFDERSSELLSQLRSQRFDAQLELVSNREVIKHSLLAPTTLLIAVLVTSLLILSCAASAYSFRRSWAVQRTNGISRPTICLRRAAQTTLLLVSVISGVLVFTTTLLWFYNGGVRTFDFIHTYLIFALAITMVVLLTDALATFEATSGMLVNAIRGRSVGKASLLRALAVKVLTVVALVLLVGPCVGAVDNIKHLNAAGHHWDKANGLVALGHSTLQAHFGHQEEDAFNRKFRRFVAGISDRRIVVCDPQSEGQLSDAGYNAQDGNLLFVNEGYVRRFAPQLNNVTSQIVPKVTEKTVTVTYFYPEEAAKQRDQIAKSLQREFAFQWDLDHDSHTPRWKLVGFPLPLSAREMFNLRVDWRSTRSSISIAPVVVIVDPLMPGISGNWLASSSTKGAMLFDDRDELQVGLRRIGIADLVPRVYGASDRAAQFVHKARVAAWTDIATFVLALACVGVASVFALRVYIYRVRRKTTVQMLNGASIVTRHFGAVIAVCAIILFGAVLIYWQGLSAFAACLVILILLLDGVLSIQSLGALEKRQSLTLIKAASI